MAAPNPPPKELAQMVAALDERVGAVEEALTAHIAGAGRRQQEINRLRGDLDRARWRVRFGKGR